MKQIMINSRRFAGKYLSAVCCLLIALCGASRLRAQNCPALPADCPVADYANLDLADDSTDKLNNPIVPQEVAMEHRLRRVTGELMSRIAEKEHWDFAELTEEGSSGFRLEDGSVLRYELRPPHSFHIVYQVIVNNDSLAAWSAWLKDLTDRRMNNMNQYTTRVTAQQDKIQAYMDSANYWALKGNSKRSNAFIERATALQKDAGTEQNENNFETEKKGRGLAWRDATVLLVEFDFNGDNARVEDGRAAAGAASAAAGTGSSAFTLLHWYTIPEPDPLAATNYYSHSKNVALALTGAWNPQPNGEGFYTPRFARDKMTIKNIKSDKVQTIALTLSGNRAAMRKFLSDLPDGELNTW